MINTFIKKYFFQTFYQRASSYFTRYSLYLQANVRGINRSHQITKILVAR